MEDHVEEIRAQLDCRQLAESYGVKIRNRSGEWWMASCFNAEAHARGDRNPSLSIGPTGYKCFSINCGISGDVFDLIAFFEGLDVRQQFHQVLKIAAEHAGVDLQYLRDQSSNFAPTAHHKRQNQEKRILSRATRPQKRRIERLKQERPQGPRPSFAQYFPRPDYQPWTIDPAHPRLEIMQNLWSILADAPLSEASVQWLQRRGLSPEIAHVYGCRDWTVKRDELLRLFDKYDFDVLEASGLIRPQEDGSYKKWVGLRALDSESWAQGMGFPVVHPGWTQAPIAWRWRLFEPIQTKRGSTLKAMAQYGGIPAVPMIPLGLAPPDDQALLSLSWWPHLTNDPVSPKYVVALCEGEPDWLSLAQVSALIESEIYLVPVGITAMSAGYPYDHINLLEDALGILCLMDRGNTPKKTTDAQLQRSGGQKVVDQIRAFLLYRQMQDHNNFDRAFADVDSKIKVALQPDDQDVNDLHLQGTLQDLVIDLLGDWI